MNGQEVGTVWKLPYTVDISAAVKPGANTLEVDVVNTWLNRLIGDAQPGAQPVTYTPKTAWKPGEKLLPAGLLGPVNVRSIAVQQVGP